MAFANVCCICAFSKCLCFAGLQPAKHKHGFLLMFVVIVLVCKCLCFAGLRPAKHKHGLFVKLVVPVLVCALLVLGRQSTDFSFCSC